MTREEIDAEIERSRRFIHALIDLRFSLRGSPQVHYLWRTREEFEGQLHRGQFREAIRIHPDKSWSFDPCYGNSGDDDLSPSAAMWRTYDTMYGHRYNVSKWQARPIELL